MTWPLGTVEYPDLNSRERSGAFHFCQGTGHVENDLETELVTGTDGHRTPSIRILECSSDWCALRHEIEDVEETTFS